MTFNEAPVFASVPDEVCDRFLNIVRSAEVLLTIGTDQLVLSLKLVKNGMSLQNEGGNCDYVYYYYYYYYCI